MNTRPRVVLITSQPDLPVQLATALRRAGFEPAMRLAGNEPSFCAALDQDPHLIFADSGLAEPSGLRALEIVQERGSHGAVILLAPTITVEQAVLAMKRGASDILAADNLGCLGSVVHEALARRRARRQRSVAEHRLRASEERYALAVRGANDGLWDWDLRTDRVSYSARWQEMLGYEPGKLGDSPDEWFSRVLFSDLIRLKARITMHLNGLTPRFEDEHYVQHRDGGQRWMLSRGRALRDETGRPYRLTGLQTDLTEHKRREEQLQHDAFHDALTGLPNRALFTDRLGHARERARRRSDYRYAVLFLDIDRFKAVNDTYGHAIGDQLLVGIARRLEACLRASDSVGRLSGDEFAVLLEELRSGEDALIVAERIQRELRRPFQLGGHTLACSVSIGIAQGNAKDQPGEELLHDADAQMYQAKRRRQTGL